MCVSECVFVCLCAPRSSCSRRPSLWTVANRLVMEVGLGRGGAEGSFASCSCTMTSMGRGLMLIQAQVSRAGAAPTLTLSRTTGSNKDLNMFRGGIGDIFFTSFKPISVENHVLDKKFSFLIKLISILLKIISASLCAGCPLPP